MKKEALFRSTVSAALLDSQTPLLGELLDLRSGQGVVSTYAPRLRANAPWRSQLLENFYVASVCVFGKSAFRCLIAREGQVNLYGPGGNPDRTFQIPDAGVFGPQSKGYGYVNRIQAVGDGLYVCGDHRQFYRFVWDGQNLASGRWVDVAGSMRQAPVPADAPNEPQAFEAWLDAQEDSVEFRDLGGSAGDDLYAVGDQVWHFNGQSWQQVALPTDEVIHAIKVVDAQRVALVGHNGTVLLGNAKAGFVDVSGVDDNQNFTGVEFFKDRLWLASNLGLFVYDFTSRKIAAYKTDLAVDLVDTYLLEAKDGVLWSFGYKDLAYWDSREGGSKWVRVHHPDNPRVDEPALKKARTAPPAPEAQAIQAQTAAQQAALAWLPKAKTGQLDVGGLMARVGHKGVGEFVLSQLQPQGLKPEEILRVNKGELYTVAVPKQGVELVLQCMRKTGKDAQNPERWGLAEVKLLTQNANPSSHWTGPWLGKLQPNSTQATLLAQARALWDEESANTGDQQTFFVDGPHGAQWAINLAWTSVVNRLGSLKVLHMGGYLPWTK